MSIYVYHSNLTFGWLISKEPKSAYFQLALSTENNILASGLIRPLTGIKHKTAQMRHLVNMKAQLLNYQLSRSILGNLSFTGTRRPKPAIRLMYLTMKVKLRH